MPRFANHSETLAETHHASRGIRPGHKARTSSPLKKLMTGLTAAAVAVTLLAASAVPSRADKRSDDLAKALAAALIIGTIVNGIDNNRDAKKPHHPAPKPTKSPRVPGVCAIEIDSNERGDHRGDRNRSNHNRTVTVYSERCLRDEGFNYRLPNCARDIRIYGKRDRIYSEQCLRDAGFRLDRR